MRLYSKQLICPVNEIPFDLAKFFTRNEISSIISLFLVSSFKTALLFHQLFVNRREYFNEKRAIYYGNGVEILLEINLIQINSNDDDSSVVQTLIVR